MKIEQSFITSKRNDLDDYMIEVGTRTATGLAEIKEPTLEISGLKMVQFIFKGYNPVYETPDVFDYIDYLVINGMKFKRMKDE